MSGNGYTDVFGGEMIQPSQVSYLALALTADTTLVWPTAQQNELDVVAKIIAVTPDAGGRVITMPDARQVSNGQDVLFRNLGAFSFSIVSATGTAIATVAAGTAKYIYISDNSTEAGSWAVITFGTGTSAADASALAGMGLVADAGLLDVNHPVTEINGADHTIVAGDRAKVFAWIAGTNACNLPTCASVGSGFFFFLRNAGNGTITLTPSGSDTVNDAATLGLSPGDSCVVVCDGANPGDWYTIGLGMSANFAFTNLVKNVAGAVDVVLTSGEAANKLITFTGALTGNINVIFPNTVSPYFVYNNTSGVFTLTCKTAAGTGVAIGQSTRDIITNDATNISAAITNTVTSTVFNLGSAGAPSITFIGRTTDGFYSSAVGGVGVTSGGTQRANFSASGLQVTPGVVGAPSLSFLGQLTDGFYSPGAASVALALAGTQRALFTATGMNNTAIGATTPATGAFTTGGYSGAVTLGGAITYGGVTLSNAVTGTGNMALSAGPTFTGTLTAAAITASGLVTATNFIISGGTSAQGSFGSDAGFGNGGIVQVYGSAAGNKILLLTGGSTRGTFDSSGLAVTGVVAPTLSANSTQQTLSTSNPNAGALSINRALFSTGGSNFAIDVANGGFVGSIIGSAIAGPGTAIYTSTNTQLIFGTGGVARATIDTNGGVIIGTDNAADAFLRVTHTDAGRAAAAFGSATGTSASSQILFINANGTVGSVSTSGSSTSYNTSSDYRIKEDLGLYKDSGSIIDAVPVHLGKKKSENPKPMFFAHELQAHAEWAVLGAKDGYKPKASFDTNGQIVISKGEDVIQQVDHQILVPLLWAEVQSLRRRLVAAGL